MKPPVTKGHLTLLEDSMAHPEEPLPSKVSTPEKWGDTQRLAWTIANQAHWSENISTICYVDAEGATVFVKGSDYIDAIDRAAAASGVWGDVA